MLDDKQRIPLISFRMRVRIWMLAKGTDAAEGGRGGTMPGGKLWETGFIKGEQGERELKWEQTWGRECELKNKCEVIGLGGEGKCGDLGKWGVGKGEQGEREVKWSKLGGGSANWRMSVGSRGAG